MKRTFDKKIYIIIESILLIIFLIVEIGILWGIGKALILTEFEVFIILLFLEIAWLGIGIRVFELQRILVLPMDFRAGPREELVHFKGICKEEKGDGLTKEHFYEWYMYDKNHQGMFLLLPHLQTYEEALETQPQEGQEIRISYYKYAGILCWWEDVSKS